MNKDDLAPHNDPPHTDSETSPDHVEVEETGLVIDHTLSDVINLLAQLESKFDERYAYDRLKDRQIQQFSDLAETYKSGIGYPVMRPFAREIHTIREALFRYSQSDAFDENTGIRLELELFVSQLDEALRNQGFAVTVSAAGAPFDSSRQRAVRAVPVDDQQLSGTIAASRKSGLTYQRSDGSLLTVSPEQVEVCKYISDYTGANE